MEERKNKFVIEDLDEPKTENKFVMEDLDEPKTENKFVMEDLDEPKPKNKFVIEDLDESKVKKFGEKTIKAIEDFANTEDHSKEFLIDKERKTAAAVCYLPIFFLFAYLQPKYKKDEYIRFHVNNGIVLTLSYILVEIVSNILIKTIKIDNVFSKVTPRFVYVFTFILLCVPMSLSVFGIFNTFAGKSKELPIIGKIKILK